jgi:hypothetical protein
MFKYKLYLFVILSLLILACNPTANKSLSIKFSADRTSILVSNIDESALFQLKNNINKDTTYQNLLTVLETPNDDDSTSMEREWPGKLTMNGNELEFKPDSPFIKGKSYLVETILNVSFADAEKLVKGKMNTSLKAEQQLLKR